MRHSPNEKRFTIFQDCSILLGNELADGGCGGYHPFVK